MKAMRLYLLTSGVDNDLLSSLSFSMSFYSGSVGSVEEDHGIEQSLGTTPFPEFLADNLCTAFTLSGFNSH